MVEKIKVKRRKVIIDYPTEEEFFQKEVKKLNRYEVFRNWSRVNGVIGLDRVNYPHRFDAEIDESSNLIPNTGYLGTVTTKDIKHREVIIAVPLSMCISVE
jgi:hypothetical protein